MKNPPTNGDAIAIATRWIAAADLPFDSGFISGSMAMADASLPYDPASDIDCYLVVSGDPPERKIGKITVDGVLLDVSWLPWHLLANAEANAVLASLLRFGRVVVDGDGALNRLQQGVIARFEDAQMIARRLDDMRARIRTGLAVDSSHLPEPEQVMNWLFPATLATHIPLVAACAPLTVRKRFVATKKVMLASNYESLLHLYGFADVPPTQAHQWLDDTATLFDAASPIAATSDRFWASDIQEDARPIAIGGSQLLIDTGNHREALYWIIATTTRCLTVLHDAGGDSSPFLAAFRDMITTLGIGTPTQRSARSQDILRWIDSYEPPD